jgi:GAF domain-containing protein
LTDLGDRFFFKRVVILHFIQDCPFRSPIRQRVKRILERWFDSFIHLQLRLCRAACYHAAGDYSAEADDLAAIAHLATTTLENARLYEETLRANRDLERRMAERTAELEQRHAELAIINSVQESLAAQLDLQAIFDLVGDRIRDLLDAQVVNISIYDRAANLIHFPYARERGELQEIALIPLVCFRKQVIQTRRTLMINAEWSGARPNSAIPWYSPARPRNRRCLCHSPAPRRRLE